VILEMSSTNESSLKDVLKEALGVCIHELLYIRKLYTSNLDKQSDDANSVLFAPLQYLDISVHAMRHPQVVLYIENFLNLAVPAFCSGMGDEIRLVFYNEDTDESIEEHVFKIDESLFKQHAASIVLFTKDHHTEAQKSEIHNRLVSLEREMRNLVLRIIRLDVRTSSSLPSSQELPPNTNFKLILNITERAAMESDGHDVVSQAVKDGSWIQAEDNHHNHSVGDQPFNHLTQNRRGHYDDDDDRGGNVSSRPCKSVNVPSCGLQMIYSIEKIKQVAINSINIDDRTRTRASSNMDQHSFSFDANSNDDNFRSSANGEGLIIEEEMDFS